MGKRDQVTRMMGLSAPETMPEAELDDEGVVGIDLAPSDDGLEAGIAAVFEAIRNGGGGSADENDEAPTDSGVTFALLTELNRLWERAPA
jgi:hypothetical protein